MASGIGMVEGGPAVMARILACILDVLDDVKMLHQNAPEEAGHQPPPQVCVSSPVTRPGPLSGDVRTVCTRILCAPSWKLEGVKGLATKTVKDSLGVVRRILNLAARSWRDQQGLTWRETPPLIEMLPVTGGRKRYPLDWEEQPRLMR